MIEIALPFIVFITWTIRQIIELQATGFVELKENRIK